MERQKIISIIGLGYMQPILDLYSTLISRSYSGSSKIKVSHIENGYSVSIIVLSILLMESCLNRVRYIEKDNNKFNLEFFKQKFTNIDLYNKLSELYVLRDIIVHNHVWKINFNFDNDYNEKNIYQKLLVEYGDKKYNIYVNKTLKMTKNLKLNINPIKIGINDVKIVLSTLDELFDFLYIKNNNYFPLNNNHYNFNNKYITFSQFVDELSN